LSAGSGDVVAPSVAPTVSPTISVVLVHYRAPELAAEAVALLRADCRAAGLDPEVIIVDNGDDAADRQRLGRVEAALLVPGENLGYAGGIDFGVRRARGDVLIFMNPDVLVLPGCIPALVSEIAAGADAAGPRFYWDRGARMLLPPAEERSRRVELLGRLAGRWPWLPRRVAGTLQAIAARRLRRRWRRHARRHWEAGEPIVAEELSGALLAVSRDAWERVGPFDEEYKLYFEETDWLRRLVRAGGRAVHMPRAGAVHLYDRSASTEPRSSAWFESSRRRFERRWYGLASAALLSWVRRVAGPPPDLCAAHAAGGIERPAEAPTIDLEVPPASRGPFWVEISPSALGVPAAGERLSPQDGRLRWRLPEEIWSRLAQGCYRLQVTDGAGREIAVRTIEKVSA